MSQNIDELRKCIQSNYPIFSEKELVLDMVQTGSFKKVVADELLMDYNSKMTSIPLLIKGSIRILRENEEGNEIFLYYLEKGQTCAASFTCCMNEEISNIQAIAEEDTELIMLPLYKLQEWMEKYASWRMFILATYSNRMESLLETLDMVAFKKMDERLKIYLKQKADVQKNNLLQITHQQIANELNSSREVVSRLLKSLEKAEQIKLGRNQIEVLY